MLEVWVGYTLGVWGNFPKPKWVEVVNTEKDPYVPGEHGLKTLEAALAAYHSAAEKRVVQL